MSSKRSFPDPDDRYRPSSERNGEGNGITRGNVSGSVSPPPPRAARSRSGSRSRSPVPRRNFGSRSPPSRSWRASGSVSRSGSPRRPPPSRKSPSPPRRRRRTRSRSSRRRSPGRRSPGRRSPSPPRRKRSPYYVEGSPRRRSPRRSGSARRFSISPRRRRRSPSPYRRGRRRSPSPFGRRRSRSPFRRGRRSPSPKRRSGSPPRSPRRRRSISPSSRKKSSSPEPREDKESKFTTTPVDTAINKVLPNPNLVQQMLAKQMHTANPQLTRLARRLYVGNLPIGIGLNESIITEFFNATVKSVKITTPNPVLSSWLSSEGTFCFVEFRSVQDCTLCLTLLEGLQLGGRQLRFGRPADYKPPPPHLQDYVVGGPLIPTSPAQAAVAAAAQSNGASAGGLKVPPAPPTPPTKVVVMTNMVTNEDLKDDEEYTDLVDDIKSECEKFGTVVGIAIPRPGQEPGDLGVGKVFIEYADIEFATEAQKKLDGRTFASKKIVASFYDEQKYKDKIY